MQGNGFKVGLTIFFVGLCGFYLFPSVQNLYVSYKMNNMPEEERVEYREDNRQWLEQVDASSLNLGLDLQGGMHVTLEVEIGNLLNQLAVNKDEAFQQALRTAEQRAEEENVSVVEAFVEEFEAENPDGRLSRYFRNQGEDITRRSSNDEVQEYLQGQADTAVQNGIQVVRNRVNQYGVTEPSIQRQGDERIVVELPGVSDRERVRDLLESASQLTFHLMANPQQLGESVQRMIEYYEPTAEDSARIAEAQAADTAAMEASTDTSGVTEGTELAASSGQEASGGQQQGTALTEPGESAQTGPQNSLLAAMQPMPGQEQPIIGRAFASDTSRVNELLQDPSVQNMLPPGIEPMWTASPVLTTEDGREAFHLLAVRAEPELTGEVVTEASVQFDRQTNEPKVSITMNSDGARRWDRITAANIGNRVSIVLDDIVYSSPNIQSRISGGRTEITGLESRQEAQDIVTVLQSGRLQTDLNIISERTVGPSLGEESTRAGFISVVAGFLLVVLFMIMYYRTAGVVADIALLLNLILIMGILAGFGATLTLPGIAGIVLTIGMAVDANVLVYDRVREEQATGKTLRAAINAGYEQSLSAILDANITTFFVGVILYSFGVGPIKGFAVTLMAGILASLFTAIIVTRIIFDYMVEDRRMQVSYG
ncbi:protein translocase subunit SecD [Salinibacter ruber]|jgi:preprotein translocase subunit SecD|uniref:Protein translocase subunit SecD n=2 Tax=Salinibacter ruber TaxID=146919 RepID=A0A840E8V6_9BACT|nr:protein translocase subunit SecD [Salinibacter ruber]MBB4069777.1 preprotein translocase subunit SecD [Salinibacter ruber]MBB4089231.1 preprotein translocase subunit SecD [Salinibacter ruber]MCS3627117.1 preprotein translocase subunit SecD [Salinibacter ruber]MCS3640113.1 preprotein translocase subunit SecD [Salinibacter ruber]MCS3644579.1 preprotein translocase subunit SecD [Salinibacter ruber]